jgi:hypothetical protein
MDQPRRNPSGGSPLPAPADTVEAIKADLRAGAKIAAIKRLRDSSGLGLAEAKHAVEKLQASCRRKIRLRILIRTSLRDARGCWSCSRSWAVCCWQFSSGIEETGCLHATGGKVTRRGR